MTPQRQARLVYRAGAISNFVVTIPAFVAYHRYVRSFFREEPNYPFLVWIWSGMAFLWGVSFWQISTDPDAAYPLLRYSWLEKSVTSTSVLVAYARGRVPGRVAAGVVFTDVVWIPAFMSTHARLARSRAGAS